MCVLNHQAYIVYVLLYERKCKWSYGPFCPVDFLLNIHSFIHSFATGNEHAANAVSCLRMSVVPYVSNADRPMH